MASEFDKSHWKADKEVAACEGCQGSFGLIHGRRRHHCRQCGGIFCNQCSQHRVLLPSGDGQVAHRACAACFERFQKNLSVLAMSVGNTHQLLPPGHPEVPARFGGSAAHHCTTFVQAGDGGQVRFGDCVRQVEFGFGEWSSCLPHLTAAGGDRSLIEGV